MGTNVRIPLDYYRILGLPIQAPAEQLTQAHHDRTRQMPRREYSENALAARRALLDEAYGVLSDPGKRAAYDERFLTTQYESEVTSTVEQTPHIDIAEQHLVGALLILQELGEYELVLKVGRPYLSSGRLSGGGTGLKSGQFGDPQVALSDTVLTIAFACLELGREHWQQAQHETAAEALETGEELLVREGLFEGIRAEIQSDLLRLRPYRILELLALPENDNARDRRKGLDLLQDMLRERDGVDGAGDDHSGLNMDDFLRFIQQLRSYLTAEEQQVLFEEEARRPSAVATYLAIYALIARGFAEHQPALIRRAKLLLSKLSARQDVHLEQSVCALLLGQTEEANRLLELSQEYEPIAFIREHSQGSPDWLPGLCLYTERWVGGEVFPHFRDLSQHRASLKEYFADDQVQSYLEELPLEGAEGVPMAIGLAGRTVAPVPTTPSEWRPEAAATTVGAVGAVALGSGRSTGAVAPRSRRGSASARGNASSDLEEPMETAERVSSVDRGADRGSDRGVDRGRGASRSTVAAVGAGALAAGGTIALGHANAQSNLAQSNLQSNSTLENELGEPLTERERAAMLPPEAPPGARPKARARTTGRSPQKSRNPKKQPRWVIPLWLPWALGLVGVMAMGFGISRLMRSAPTAVTPTPTPTLALATATSGQPVPVQGDLNEATAKQILELWFTTKKAAMGSGYAASQLEQALTEPKLSAWRKESGDAQRDGAHVEYDHAVEIKKVEINPTDPNRASVTANVRELRKYFEGSTMKEDQTDDLQLRYTLIRQNNQWKISDWQ
jgi:ARC6-like, IMS domain